MSPALQDGFFFLVSTLFLAALGPHCYAQASSSCTSRGVSSQVHRLQSFQHAGSVVVVHGFSCSTAHGIFPEQLPNPCLLRWQADSSLQDNQGSPKGRFLTTWPPGKSLNLFKLAYEAFWGFPGGSVVKKLLVNPGAAGEAGSTPGLRRSPGGGNGHPLEYSCWEIPWTEKPGGLQSTVSQRVWYYWSTEDACMTPFRIWPQPTFTALSSHSLPPCLLLGSFSVPLISLLLLLLGLHICCFQVHIVGTCQNEMGLFLVCSSDTS